MGAVGATTKSASELVEGATLLGLPVGLLPEAPAAPTTAPVQPTSLPGPPGPTASIRDVVVVDLTSLWAGPLCGRLLAEADASVVKVESTARPDGARRGPPAFFDLLNHRKRSVAVDLRTSAGVDALARLLEAPTSSSRPRGRGRSSSSVSTPAPSWPAAGPGYGRPSPATDGRARAATASASATTPRSPAAWSPGASTVPTSSPTRSPTRPRGWSRPRRWWTPWPTAAAGCSTSPWPGSPLTCAVRRSPSGPPRSSAPTSPAPTHTPCAPLGARHDRRPGRARHGHRVP